MTGELLAIIILIVAWLLTAAWWRFDTARWHAIVDKLETRLQSQVPAVLDRQDSHEERKAELTQAKETYGEEPDLEAQMRALVEGSEITSSEGQSIVRDIAG